MLISVVTCTYRADSYQNVLELVSGLLNQTYRNLEIIIVIDGNEELHRKIAANYQDRKNVLVVASPKSIGVSGARDLGISVAHGDPIAFIDDDAIADGNWVKGLHETCQKYDAIAVAGKVLPLWLSRKPEHLPEELYWLVGLTYTGYAKDGITEVRNAFGSNMVFRREVFEKVGGFNQGFGFAKKGKSYIQAEEPELALKMKAKLGKGVIYNPELIVYHKVPERKTRLGVLTKRAFFQGYSKALIRRTSIAADPLATEQSYFKDLLLKYIPCRIKSLFTGGGSVNKLKQLVILIISIIVVGLGFACGHVYPFSTGPVTARGQSTSIDTSAEHPEKLI
jgi:glycosyltransferase involved in cell wall biosynthesis